MLVTVPIYLRHYEIFTISAVLDSSFSRSLERLYRRRASSRNRVSSAIDLFAILLHLI